MFPGEGSQWTPEQIAEINSCRNADILYTGVPKIDYQLLKQREAGEPINMLKASVAARIAALEQAPALSEKSDSRPEPSFDWRHELIARALCQADGHDPDLKVVDVHQAAAGPFGSVAAGAVQPAWHCYLPMSAGIVGALAKAK